ncbi:MAG TPA: NADH-quinone oxidoreductase subunit H [archaeon]|nr:NADH-quinone oxidoreductase subunit H [archaeon]
MSWEFAVYGAVNVAFVALVSPLFMGVIRKIKALVQGRRGPPLLQGYYNLAKLMKKETVFSSNSSVIMEIAPYISISALFVAALLVPVIMIPEPAYGMGGIILFLYMLALAKFFTALAGLDAGSTFGGMGSSREMTISAIIEPIIVVVFAALAFALNTTNIYAMFAATAGLGVLSANVSLLPLVIALFIILITETSRVPVDNPETHLELTMVHEAMILEQGGRNLALMEVSHAVKQTLLMAFLINIFFPWGISQWPAGGWSHAAAGALAFLAKGVILAAVVGLFESSMAKMRLFRLPTLFMAAFFLSALTIVMQVFA